MRKNIEKVIKAFTSGVSAQGDSKRTCWTDGNSIYSYNMVIAKKNPGFTSHYNVTVINPECAPSRTTRGQIRAILKIFPANLVESF
jgi:hypothetical protein